MMAINLHHHGASSIYKALNLTVVRFLKQLFHSPQEQFHSVSEKNENFGEIPIYLHSIISPPFSITKEINSLRA